MAITALGRRGTKAAEYHDFDGFLVEDVDATEIARNAASAALNIDMDGRTIRKRRGKSGYNTSLGAGGIKGLAAYYPKTGTRKMVLAWTTTVKADDGAGVFADIITGLNASATFYDLIQYRDRLYIGNGFDALYRWNGAGSAAAVSLTTAPGAGPTLSLRQTVIEDFESDTEDPSDITAGWVVDGSGVTLNLESDSPKQGSNALNMRLGSGSRGASIRKEWSTGKPEDLSTAEELVLWAQGDRLGLSFTVGIIKDGQTTFDASLFPVHTLFSRDTWVEIRVPLAAVAPSDREASPGIGILFNDKKKNHDFPRDLYFDQAMPAGPLLPGRYQYSITYAEIDANGNVDLETNPSPVVAIDLAASPPTAGILVTPALSVTAAINAVRIYRYLETGSLSRARLVATLPNDTTTLNGAINATVETLTPASMIGWSVGNILQLGTEKLQVRRVNTATLDVIRGVEGTTAASHANGATITPVAHFDAKSDGALAEENADELVSGRTVPPVAQTYAMANHRMAAGNVTISGVQYPQRVMLSRQGYPEEFSLTQDPDDPLSGGWIDLPTGEHIKRIVEYDGSFVIFCDKSIYTLEGTAWDDYVVRRRATVGLDAREAVVVLDHLVYFLAADGLRVLVPSSSDTDYLSSWVISEPVNSRLRAIPAAYRSLAALGVDEKGRVLLSYPGGSSSTVNDATLVFDPLIPGALKRAAVPDRPGWTYYTGLVFARAVTLKRGGGDNGRMILGDPSIGRLWNAFLTAADVDLETDDGAAIAWHWQSRAENAGVGAEVAIDQAEAVLTRQPSAAVTLTAVFDRGNDSEGEAKTLGTDTALTRVGRYFSGGARGRFVSLKVSGSHSVLMRVHSLAWAGYVRQA